MLELALPVFYDMVELPVFVGVGTSSTKDVVYKPLFAATFSRKRENALHASFAIDKLYLHWPSEKDIWPLKGHKYKGRNDRDYTVFYINFLMQF